MATHYEVLGVTHGADLDEVKRAYYDRARLYHPDAHASSPPAVRAEAERTMQALNQAWSVLRDDALRRRYDRSLDRELTGVGGASRGRGRSGAVAGSAAGGSSEASPAAARERHAARRGGSSTTPRRSQLGSGFQYWFGAGAKVRSAGGRTNLNLRVTGTSLAGLQSLLPAGLAGLHAEHTSVGDTELRHLQGMTSLRFVDLSDTPVTDAGLVHLLGSRELETLILWDTAITDAGLALIARFPNLCQLGLGNTRITDDGLRHLAGLHRLRLVQLAGTAVQGPGLRHLHGLPQLATVSLPWKVRGRHRRRLRSALPRTGQVL